MHKIEWVVIILALVLTGVWWGQRGIEVVNAPPRAGVIIALGDSLTEGVGASSREAAYPGVLAGLIGQPVLNRGVRGHRIADGAARLSAEVLAESPSIVLLGLGGNDLLAQRGAGGGQQASQNLDAAFAQLGGMIEQIQVEGAMVVLLGIKGQALIANIAWRYEALAEQYGCLYIEDMLDDLQHDPAMMSDAIHPNDAGYAHIAARVADALEPYL